MRERILRGADRLEAALWKLDLFLEELNNFDAVLSACNQQHPGVLALQRARALASALLLTPDPFAAMPSVNKVIRCIAETSG